MPRKSAKEGDLKRRAKRYASNWVVPDVRNVSEVSYVAGARSEARKVAEMRKMLSLLVWQGGCACPVCWRKQADGHTDDCRLARLIGGKDA